MHYADFNRRMDEWIPFANFREEDGSMPKLVAVASVGSVKNEDDDSSSPGSSSPSERSGAATKKARLSTELEVHDARAPTVAAAAAADVRVVKKNENVGEFIEELTTDAMDEESLKEHDELTKVKNVGELEIGRYRIDTWLVYFFLPPYSVTVVGFLRSWLKSNGTNHFVGQVFLALSERSDSRWLFAAALLVYVVHKWNL